MRTRNFITSSSAPEKKKPTSGEISSASPIVVAWPQSTPEVPERPLSSALVMPTPMIEPISVWDEEAGRPKYQVPRFHRMAAISSAKTIAKPACDDTCRISSTGSSEMTPNATAPVEVSTPMKFQVPDHTTA